MKFSLVICTYMRPEPLLKLLGSVNQQQLYPDEIIIVDGSTNTDTEEVFKKNSFENLRYYMVDDENRGLTKQRNFGVSKVSDTSEIVCFLDDDIILKPSYFSTLISTYNAFPEALGVGGYIISNTHWRPVKKEEHVSMDQFSYDGWIRKDGSRFVLRKRLGLDSDRPPAHLPSFSHGRSVSFLPPSGKIYPVEQFMGGVSSFRKNVLQQQKFSEYFEGYGLYEDADYTLRLSKKGPLYVNTSAQLYHYHEESGRPDMLKYGKMVVRNGWYVWRVKYPKPGIKARLKWNAISGLLTLIRFGNSVSGSNKRSAFNEAIGRTVGWWSLIFNKPKIR